MYTYATNKIVEASQEARDENPGYLVKYSDGYESWSPAKSFDEAAVMVYPGEFNVPAYIKRLAAEYMVNKDRLTKLSEFLLSDIAIELPVTDRADLFEQESIMTDYGKILKRRLLVQLANTPYHNYFYEQ